MKPNQKLLLLLAVLFAVSLPYILAAALGGEEYAFGGFLLNPLDGNTYLAKMRLGWDGEWQFTLPYTAQQGEGSYLFLFYLFLGHFSRWVSWPLLDTFHFARIAASAFLVLTVIEFCEVIFADRSGWVKPAAWLAVIGSGMGWLVLLAGQIPSDFWVAETYPFLSMYATPHFALGLAILLKILLLSLALKDQPEDQPLSRPRFSTLAWLLVFGFIESIILPFAMVVLAVILVGWFMFEWADTRKAFWSGEGQHIATGIAAVFALGGPWLLYQYWATLQDPLLAGWNAQNLTPSPPLWDFLLSLSPALPLALLGVLKAYQERQQPGRRLLLAWFGLGVLLVYVPLALQRRFMLGLYLPTAALAIFGLQWLVVRLRKPWVLPLVFGLALPTNLLLLVMGLFGILGHSPQYYMSADEYQALQWIKRKTTENALVLASPEVSAWIPAHTGRWVIYGHPFETVNAAVEEQNVLSFYSSEWTGEQVDDFLQNRGVDYIFAGDRERLLREANEDGSPYLQPDLSRYPVVYEKGAVTIYAVSEVK